MGILNIRLAAIGGSKAILGLAGTSGTGKTYTALQIARGMVDNPAKIGLLDTENKRGSLYADILDGPFLIGDLYPPFSPGRYSDAIKEFQEAGVEVLVIDSVTHEWEGDGGCDDIANTKIGKMDNWIGAKKQHKKFMSTLLQSNMHIICCIRAREKTDFKNPSKPVSLGIQPICEKNFMFEMTASVMMEEEGKRQRYLKIPYFLREAFGKGEGYLGREHGKKILAWINLGEKDDPEIAKAKSEMTMACEFGMAGLMAYWNKLDKKAKVKLDAHKNVCKASAEEYDRQAKEADELPQDELRRVIANGKQAEIIMP